MSLKKKKKKGKKRRRKKVGEKNVYKIKMHKISNFNVTRSIIKSSHNVKATSHIHISRLINLFIFFFPILSIVII